MRRQALCTMLGTLLLGVGACVTPNPVIGGQDLATLEVVNRTNQALSLDVRGNFETVLPAGSRTKVRNLSPGPARLAAYSEGGRTRSAKDATRLAFQRDEHLNGSQTKTWTIGSIIPIDHIKGLGSLKVTNTLSRDLQITLNQRALGYILAGDTRTFRDVPTGEYIGQASDRTLKTVIDQLVNVPVDATATWKIAQAVGQFAIINDTEESVDFVMNEEAIGRVNSNSRRLFREISPGQHELVGISSLTRHRYQNTLDVKPNSTSKWGLKTGSGSITVVNHTTEKLTVVPRGTLVPADARTIEIEPGTSKTVENVQPGLMTLHAVGDREQILYSTQAQIRKGQQFYWDVEPRAATGRVVNNTKADIILFAKSRRLATLGPRESTTLGDLPTEEFELIAHSSKGSVYKRFVPAAPRQPLTWSIVSGTGLVKVTNNRDTPIAVYRNAQFVGKIKEKTTVTFTGMPIGRQLFESVDVRSSQLSRHWVQVTKNEAAILKVDVEYASLSIHNESGEVLLVNGHWAQQTKSIQSNSNGHFIAGPGTRTLSLRGRESGLIFVRSFELQAGQQQSWRIAKPVGSIRVLNELSEALAVAVDDNQPVIVEANGFHDFTSISGGIHRLKAAGLTSGRIYRENRRIQPDGNTVWKLAREQARLLIKNHDQSDILIELDGRPYGVVFGGSSKIFAGLETGLRKLRAVATNNHSVRRHDVNLVGGRTDTVSIHPSRGTVVIENVSGEDVKIAVDDVTWPMKIDQAPTEFPVDAGIRLLRVTRRDSQTESVYRVRIRPYRSVHLSIGKPTARISVRNSTSETLAVFIGDRELGDVSPGDELISDQLQPGSVKLIARSISGQISHIEERILQAGSTSLWDLK